MNIKEAKEEINHTLLAYNRKDAAPDIIVMPHFTDYGKLCDGQDLSGDQGS